MGRRPFGSLLGCCAGPVHAAENREAFGERALSVDQCVTEARAPDTWQDFGEQRLSAFLASNRSETPQRIIEQLVAYLREWSGQHAFTDDFTMVVVKRK